jgi:hypothetical protein
MPWDNNMLQQCELDLYLELGVATGGLMASMLPHELPFQSSCGLETEPKHNAGTRFNV